MKEQARYWMVHGSRYGREPNYKHATREFAATEAQRLASLHPGEVFTVLEVVDAYWIPKPEPERLAVVDDEIPAF